MVNPGREVWPIAGRQDELDAIASWFHDRDVGGVLLTGDAGIGKTALASRAAEVLPAQRVVRVTGNPALTGVTYGALAHLLPPDAVDSTGEVSRTEALRSLEASSGRTVMVVDDPADLDEGSLGLIAQLVAAGTAFLIATIRSSSAAPSALVALERSQGVRRLTVEPLDAATIAVVLHDVLGGAVSPTTVQALAAASDGNPLYLRELVGHAFSNELLDRDDAGSWHLVGPLGPSRGLSDVIADRIGRLADDLRELAKILAIGAPLRWSVLERQGYADPALELERLGVVAVHDATDPIVEIGHPMHSDILRDDIRVLERRRLLAMLIDWLDTAGATIDERLRVAEWQLQLGRTPDIRTLEEGAHRAFSARDHAAAERFAAAALGQRPSLGMAAILVDALIHTGRADEADRIAEGHLAQDVGNEPRQRSRLVGLRVFNNLWYRERPETAAEIVTAERRIDLDAVAADELLIHEAYVELGRANPQAVLDLIDGRHWTAEVAPQGLLLTAQMQADVGRVAEGLRTIEAAAEASRAAAAMTLSTPGSIDAATVRLTMLSGELDAASALVTRLSARPAYRSDPFIIGYLHMTTGRIELWRGRPQTARSAFREGRRIAEQQTNRVVVMGCVAGLATASAHLGDTTACAALIPELESFDLSKVIRPSIATGLAWALTATGQPARARDLLVEEATHSHARHERADAAALALEAARLGAGANVRDLMEQLLAEVDGIGTLFAEAGLALAGSSLDELTSAEGRAADSGMRLLAAELATAAAHVHRRNGDRRAAAAARTRATAHLGGCEGASTPGIVFAGDVAPLSSREREIASLASMGLSNQEIAERLFVSVRTVGNHLQSAYTKLGISGRAQLGDALSTTP